MSIDTSAKLMYGLVYSEFIEGLTEEEIEAVNEALDEGEMDSASPWYDAPREHWIVGTEISIDGYSAEDAGSKLKKLSWAWEEYGNKTPEMHCVPHVF